MKNLPNKIYLIFGDMSQEEYDAEDYNELDGITFCGDKVYDTNQEYVRKDALLEWAKEWTKMYPYSFQILADKINSL